MASAAEAGVHAGESIRQLAARLSERTSASCSKFESIIDEMMTGLYKTHSRTAFALARLARVRGKSLDNDWEECDANAAALDAAARTCDALLSLDVIDLEGLVSVESALALLSSDACKPRSCVAISVCDPSGT